MEGRSRSFVSREVTRLPISGSDPTYLPTGHILYVGPDGTTLRAVGFDATRLEVTTPSPVPVLNLWRVPADEETGQTLGSPDLVAAGSSGGLSGLNIIFRRKAIRVSGLRHHLEHHAALCPMYLGVKAVLVKSMERIHHGNLINFGILPLTFAQESPMNS